MIKIHKIQTGLCHLWQQPYHLGIIKIFEGAATLGAALLDLGVDKDRVEAVEAYFDEINPFDEAAESTGIGKITELIVNIGVPGGLAFKAGKWFR